MNIDVTMLRDEKDEKGRFEARASKQVKKSSTVVMAEAQADSYGLTGSNWQNRDFKPQRRMPCFRAIPKAEHRGPNPVSYGASD